MTNLEDAFGEEFAQGVQDTIQEKRRERNQVTEEQKAHIARQAINEGRFSEENPRFQFTTDNNITHNVLLMQVPEMQNRTVWEFLEEPWEGAARLPLDYLGEWMSCTFPDKNDVKQLDAGDWYIIIGGIDTYTTEDGEEGESVYPVRGLLSLEQAKEYAEEGLEEEGFPAAEDEEDTTSEDLVPDEEDEAEEEPDESTDEGVQGPGDVLGGDDEEEDDEPEDEEEDDDEGSIFDSSSEEDEDEEEEEEQAPYHQVEEEVEKLADKEPEVWEIDEDDGRMNRLVEVVMKKTGFEDEDAVRSKVVRVINKHQEEEEESTEKEQLF